MKIKVNPVWDMESCRLVAWNAEYEHRGPIHSFGGPSAQAQANEAAQTNFYNTMTQEQATTFGEHQDLYNQIKAVSLPILQAGPNSYGFTPEEDALLRGEISSQADQATTNAVNAQQLREKQLSGGAAVLPSGAQEQLELQARELGGQAKAQQLTGERLTGYQVGQQKYGQALSALTGEQQLISPTSYATAATGAGESATGAVKLADSERSNLLTSILGGAIGAGTSFLTGGLSNITGGGSFFSPKAG